MPARHLADATDLEQWADRMEGRYNLPELIRRLVLATSNPTHIDFRAQEGTGYGGWDGHVEAGAATIYVPEGVSGWEMGAGANPQDKANRDYRKRTKKPVPFNPAQTSFVFCTPRRWEGKEAWLNKRRKEGVWKEVYAYDADNLATWLADAPGVHVWFSLRIGKPIEHVQDLASWWQSWSSITSPHITPELLLSGRAVARDHLIENLTAAPDIIAVRAESTKEALAFVAAVIEAQPPILRDTLRGRTLLIDERGAWRYFASQGKSLILIPRFRDTALANQAVQNGHHVIVPVGADHRLSVTVDVPRLSAVEARDILEKEGLSSPIARHGAALARRSLAAYRRVRAAVSLDIPDWAQGEHGPALLPCILAGEWEEDTEGDREALKRLAGRPYKEIKTLLLRWHKVADAPLRLIGSRWSVNAKEDAWRLLAQYAMAEDLRTFVDLVQEVLPEQDPKRGLSREEQFAEDMRGKRRRYSSALRNGLADSLAMLGALGSPEAQIAIADGSDTSGFVTWAVRDLMERANETREVWLDLASHLRALAEAAPDTFLNAVESDLARENPTQFVLFEPQPGFLSPNYDHPQLLWALEQLAWSPTYFPRVALILARLAAVAPSTKIVNSPFDSLLSFFRLWMPQCGATSELRLQSLDHIRSRLPNVAWNLMVSLLPTGHDSATVQGGPGARAVLWRDWPSEAVQPTRPEYWESVKEISNRLLEDVSIEPARWLTLIGHLPHLYPSLLDEALGKLERLPSSFEDADLQVKLWTQLRDLISEHREYSEADWAMPETLLSRLDPICNALAPNDPLQKHDWLFKRYPRLGTKIDSHQERFDEVHRLRVDAIEVILSAENVEGVFAFAEGVESPSDVGSALFPTNPDPQVTRKIIAALGQTGSLKQVAQGFVLRAIREEGSKWIEEFLSPETLHTWDDEMRVTALLCLPFDNDTLDLVDSYGETTQRLYWQRLNHFWTDDPGLFHRAIENLIQFERPRRALDILAMRSHDKNTQLNFETVQQALYHSLVVPLEQDATQISPYDAKKLLTYLRDHPDSDKDILTQLEWAYLSLLGYGHGQLYLHESLAVDPAFFVEIVGFLWKKDTETEPSPANPESAKRAWHLLNSWRSVPGLQEDGTLDDVYLKGWVQQTIELLEEAELRKGGLQSIGQMLRWGPSEQDGIWPAPAICEIIQELSSDLIDNNFSIAIYNSRGTTSRGSFEGGGQERELTERYEGYARALDAQWPRVAAILRQLAAGYRSEAKRHDQEAERGEDESG